MHRSFKDAGLAGEFAEKGFVVVPLLQQEEVEGLLRFYYSLEHQYKTSFGFHVSIDDKDPGFIANIDSTILDFCLPRLADLFSNIQAFSGRFLVKEPKRSSMVTPHQDWTFVDEQHCSSAIVWIALGNVDVQNGALGVLKGSHRLDTGYRATPLPIFQAPYAAFSHGLFAHMELIPMKAGEAMIMDNRLIHGSPPNTGEADRLAAGFEIAPAAAPLIHYHLSKKDGRHRVLKYDIDPTFFHYYSNAKLKAVYESAGEISGFSCSEVLDYEQATWTENQFWAKLGGMEAFPFDTRLKTLFDYSFDHIAELPPAFHPTKKSFFARLKSWVRQ